MAPASTRIGNVVHISRGYTIAEILETGDAGEKLIGYSVFGYRSNTALVLPTQDEAMAELAKLAEQK
jgi:hypothetical protein